MNVAHTAAASIPDGTTAEQLAQFKPIVQFGPTMEFLISALETLAPVKYISKGPTYMEKETL